MCSNLTVNPLHHILPDPKTSILVDSNGSARLAGFAFVTTISDQPTSTSTFLTSGVTRWMSPEILNPKKFGLRDSCPTKESDCYALGMVIYEILSGKVPFAQYSQPTIMTKIMEGERPERPQGKQRELFTDEIWGTVELCWKNHPRDRLSASAVLPRLEGHPPPLRSLFDFNGDGYVGMDIDDEWDADAEISQRENAMIFSPSSPSPKPQVLSVADMAEVISYGDMSGLSTSWTRRGRFGGRLTTRTPRDWLIRSPGRLFGITDTSS